MDKYQLAVSYFENKEFGNAQQLLNNIVQAEPDDFDAWNFLGIIELTLGNYEQAVVPFTKAVECFEMHPGAHYNLGLCYQALDKNSEALYHYQRAVELDITHSDAHNNLGAVYAKLKEYGKAEEAYKNAVAYNPDNQNAANNLGNLNLEQGKYNEAIEYYKLAISLDDKNPDFYYNIGNCYLKLSMYDDALKAYNKTLDLNSRHTEALNNIGIIYNKMHDHESAAKIYEKILALSPENDEALFNLGYCYQSNNEYDKAIDLYKKAFDANSDSKGALINIGNILNGMGKASESEEYYKKAILTGINKAVTYTNLGVAKLEQEQFEEALSFFDAALEIDPELAETHYNKSHLLLLTGRFEEGWKEYEWRLRRKDFITKEYAKPPLTEQEIRGKRIFVYDEQGLGDSIQFVRYLSLLKAKGAYVIYECDARLIYLCKSMPFIDELYYRGQDNDEKIIYDYHIPLLSLPCYFKTKFDTIPADVPYIFPDERLSNEWIKVIGDNPLYKIGIVWAGNPNHTGDHKRSCPLKEFAPLFSFEEVRVFSLQKNNGRGQVKDLNFPIIDLDTYIQSFSDTLAAIDHLDLVITVDTSVAHLAGAAGKKVWLIIPSTPDWRWMLNRNTSPWYPTMKIFRQKAPGDWRSVFQSIAKALEKEIANKKDYISNNIYDTAGTIYLGLAKGENFGWGVCSKYLKLELSKIAKTVNLGEHPEMLELQKLKGRVFHALTDINFNSLYNIKGSYNTGYTFFENELTKLSAEKAKGYDLILAGSTWCNDKMQNAGITNTGVLIQGIDPEVFYPSEEIRENNLFVIFSGGKFEYRKGQDLVLKAVKILQDKYKDIILVNAWYNFWPATMLLMKESKHINFEMQGNNWDEFMKHLYRINNMDEKRIFTLPVVPNTKLRELYLKTDVGLFPNRCEGGTNLVLMEYMACGKPVIASYTSGHTDILTDENSLKLTSLNECKIYNNDNQLAADWQEPQLDEIIYKLEYAYLNREAIKTIGKKAGSSMKNYTWEKTARDLYNFLNI